MMTTITKRRFNHYAQDPEQFRHDLLIDVDVDGTPRQFGELMDQWQWDDFASLDPALQRCNGRSTTGRTPVQRAYLERPRGHSKTTDLAVTCVWALAFAKRPIKAFAFAADGDQAKLLKDAMHTILRLNPWLKPLLNVQRSLVENVAHEHPGFGSKLEIASSDVGSSYGILPDLIVADELVHWQGDGSLWNSILSSAAKRSACLLVVISNAGFADSWQWKVREGARTDPSWYFSRIDGPQASWLLPERLAEQERLLPPAAYARLWLNEWSSGAGDALNVADLDAAFVKDLSPMTKPQTGFEFVAGLDLGVSRDAAALCVLGVHRGQSVAVNAYVSRFSNPIEHGRIRLAYTKVWRPSKDAKVNLQAVEDEVMRLHKLFTFKSMLADAWQAVHMSQRLRLSRLPVQEIQMTPSTHQRIATRLIEAFSDRRVEFFKDADLERDLRRFRVVEKSYGFRLESPRDQFGHGDLGTAFSLAMLAASEIAAQPLSNLRRIGAAWSDNDLGSLPEWMKRARREAELFEKEQQEWRKGDDHSFATALKLETVKMLD